MKSAWIISESDVIAMLDKIAVLQDECSGYKAALEKIVEVGTRNEGTEFKSLSGGAQIAQDALKGR